MNSSQMFTSCVDLAVFAQAAAGDGRVQGVEVLCHVQLVCAASRGTAFEMSTGLGKFPPKNGSSKFEWQLKLKHRLSMLLSPLFPWLKHDQTHGKAWPAGYQRPAKISEVVQDGPPG